jgi:hypothetical protein
MPSDTHLSRQPIGADAQPGGAFDAIVVGAGLAGWLYTACARSAFRRGLRGQAAASGHVALEPLPGAR